MLTISNFTWSVLSSHYHKHTYRFHIHQYKMLKKRCRVINEPRRHELKTGSFARNRMNLSSLLYTVPLNAPSYEQYKVSMKIRLGAKFHAQR